MGRSNSRSRSRVSSQTRAFSSNQRLRSDSLTSSIVSPLPYSDLSRINVSSPSLLSKAELRRPLVFNPPRQPVPGPALRAGGRSVPRSGTLHPSLRRKAFTPVPSSPAADERRTTMVCVSRSTRREVLHATGQAGKAGQKPPVYNRLSKIHCRRKK